MIIHIPLSSNLHNFALDSTNPGLSNFVFRSKSIAEAEMSNRLITE